MRRAKEKRWLTPFGAGALTIAIVAILSFLVFRNDIPFTRPYEIKFVLANAQGLRPHAHVRIAGVNVGQVQEVEPKGDGTTTLVTVSVDERGRPVFTDAQVKIRPQIFLEGNWFVDLKPGTPGHRELRDGETIPISQTSGPVQLDQVLTSLQADTRKDLRTVLKGYGEAINGKPQPGEDADQDPDVKGLTAGGALNKSLVYAPDALRGVAIVNQASLGTDLHDLSKLIAGTQRVTAALSANDQNLKDLVTNFNTTVGAFASRQADLRSTIHQLPDVLDLANTTFDDLNRAFPPTRAFAREILPGVRQNAATIDAAFPWIRQVRGLVSPPELQGLVRDLRPAVSSLSSVTDQTIVLLPQVDLANRCMLNVVLPTGDKPIDDGFLSTGQPNYKDFWQTMSSLASESQNFDGNGQYTRFQPGGGRETLSTGPTGVTTFSGPIEFGNPGATPLGTRPARPASKPPFKTDFPCYRNTPPNLAAKTGSGF